MKYSSRRIEKHGDENHQEEWNQLIKYLDSLGLLMSFSLFFSHLVMLLLLGLSSSAPTPTGVIICCAPISLVHSLTSLSSSSLSKDVIDVTKKHTENILQYTKKPYIWIKLFFWKPIILLEVFFSSMPIINSSFVRITKTRKRLSNLFKCVSSLWCSIFVWMEF